MFFPKTDIIWIQAQDNLPSRCLVSPNVKKDVFANDSLLTLHHRKKIMCRNAILSTIRALMEA